MARSLAGVGVLVTRPKRQAAEMVRQLRELGANVDVMPVIEIGPPPDPAAVDRVIERLGEFSWIVFSSANGVEAFLGRLEGHGRTLAEWPNLRIAAVGPRTAEVLAERGWPADLVPEDHRAEGLVSALRSLVPGGRVLLPRADRGRELLIDKLGKLADVESLTVYSQTDIAAADPAIVARLLRGEICYVVLTSANIARAFVRMMPEPVRQRLGGEIQLVSISPRTSEAIRALGYQAAGEARTPSIEALAEAVVEVYHREK